MRICMYEVHPALMQNRIMDYSCFITELFEFIHALTLWSIIIPFMNAIIVGKQIKEVCFCTVFMLCL